MVPIFLSDFISNHILSTLQSHWPCSSWNKQPCSHIKALSIKYIMPGIFSRLTMSTYLLKSMLSCHLLKEVFLNRSTQCTFTVSSFSPLVFLLTLVIISSWLSSPSFPDYVKAPERLQSVAIFNSMTMNICTLSHIPVFFNKDNIYALYPTAILDLACSKPYKFWIIF